MRVCEICKKGSLIQKSGAHQYGGGWAMRATKKRKVWQVNLHSVKVTYLGMRQTMRLCTKCLRRVKTQMAQSQKGKTSIKAADEASLKGALST
ncbi:hypothetical protein A3I53_00990 [Candidatus Curtissbacteria bacterium RIFCSPLOWO2_02_FULL_40_13b]|uniref:50S ribosomal protein L28 n=3 Tax=Candidatus Curtissiibacteriota TaxID=1752717 RepID=A0A1F5HXS6_9BACT|nr:MAG: hypothetical protein A2693_02520 [Candidatus Curtissbacteria bacterium RIFCSPHIGHO2_01_FULL_40_12]OGE04312.1 MAG: hypothetical protein A3F45_04500 [Candidatus Curtissbacteria bacterium RIFCSPHIGHO2_12_FULL_41_17]OGE08941.1 MAG: hypothetical protein A3I53_00990 [Candidatus Curtissbacteria bacterium RIFCSPLOWO2_02_FULL_40_13b]